LPLTPSSLKEYKPNTRQTFLLCAGRNAMWFIRNILI
jgi:hypothetical protein